MKQRLFVSFTVALLCIAVSLAAFAGRYKDLELFSQVLNLAERSYFRPVPFKQLVHGAIKGMLRELDGHSHFFLPEELAAFKRRVHNKAFILGIEADKDRETGAFLILSVVKRSPAARAGLKAGDKILRIDGKRADRLTLTDLNRMLQTKSQKTLLTARPPEATPFKIKIRPGMVRLDPAVRFDWEGYSYLRIYQFSASSFHKISKILRNPLPEKGLIIDLRGNPGGLFDQSVKTADLFIKEGVITHYKGRGGAKKSFRAKEANALSQSFPLVVLIDERSASGSEILAGALKDHSRALIVGRKSFGKGSVQSFFRAGKDYGLKLTVGEYTTPKGSVIHQKGISPHIELPDRRAAARRDGADLAGAGRPRRGQNTTEAGGALSKKSRASKPLPAAAQNTATADTAEAGTRRGRARKQAGAGRAHKQAGAGRAHKQAGDRGGGAAQKTALQKPADQGKSKKGPLQDEEVQAALNILKNFPLYSKNLLD